MLGFFSGKKKHFGGPAEVSLFFRFAATPNLCLLYQCRQHFRKKIGFFLTVGCYKKLVDSRGTGGVIIVF